MDGEFVSCWKDDFGKQCSWSSPSAGSSMERYALGRSSVLADPRRDSQRGENPESLDLFQKQKIKEGKINVGAFICLGAPVFLSLDVVSIAAGGSHNRITPKTRRFEDELLHDMNFATEGASVGQKTFSPEQYSQETV